jgi:hypothetical protein
MKKDRGEVNLEASGKQRGKKISTSALAAVHKPQ